MRLLFCLGCAAYFYQHLYCSGLFLQCGGRRYYHCADKCCRSCGPGVFSQKINASFLIICSSAVLTAAFTAVTLAGGEFFQLFLLVFCCVIAVVTAFYGWQDLQGRERKSKLSVIIVIAVVIVLLMGLFVLYICPVKDGVSYGIKGDSYTVMRVKNSEKIIIADTVNGLKVTSVQRGVFYGKDKCEELYIPSSVNYIHEGALFQCVL